MRSALAWAMLVFARSLRLVACSWMARPDDVRDYAGRTDSQCEVRCLQKRGTTSPYPVQLLTLTFAFGRRAGSLAPRAVAPLETTIPSAGLCPTASGKTQRMAQAAALQLPLQSKRKPFLREDSRILCWFDGQCLRRPIRVAGHRSGQIAVGKPGQLVASTVKYQRDQASSRQRA